METQTPRIMSVKEFVVTDNAIDLALERLENLDEVGISELFERLSHEQPAIMGFVVGLGQGLKNDEAEEDLLYLTLIVWYSIELAKNGKVTTLEEGLIDQIQNEIEKRYDLIMSFSEEEEEDEIEALIQASSQPAIVNYLADEFFSEEYVDMNEDKVAKMFACTSVLAEHFTQ